MDESENTPPPLPTRKHSDLYKLKNQQNNSNQSNNTEYGKELSVETRTNLPPLPRRTNKNHDSFQNVYTTEEPLNQNEEQLQNDYQEQNEYQEQYEEQNEKEAQYDDEYDKEYEYENENQENEYGNEYDYQQEQNYQVNGNENENENENENQEENQNYEEYGENDENEEYQNEELNENENQEENQNYEEYQNEEYNGYEDYQNGEQYENDYQEQNEYQEQYEEENEKEAQINDEYEKEYEYENEYENENENENEQKIIGKQSLIKTLSTPNVTKENNISNSKYKSETSLQDKNKYQVGIQGGSGQVKTVETKVVRDFDKLFGGDGGGDKNKHKKKWLKRRKIRLTGEETRERSISSLSMNRFTKVFTKAKNKQVQRPIEETRIFGVPLRVAIEREGREQTSPPSIIEKAIMYLEEKGKFEEGIYRLSGSVLQMRELKEKFDRGKEVSLDGVKDQNTVGSLIKLYFRELPEPLLGEKYTPRLSKLSSQSEDVIKKRLIHVYNNIPEVNKAVLRWLLPHLFRVSLQSETNKMTPQNLAIVFSPTLHIPLTLMAFMITNWMDILCDDENEKEQKKIRQEN
ncbi:rho/rac/cdc gtpase-activating protein [Anaeramoeba flamelloides]|uniref:Rho/rac/cdc gtpase-activating protein n=1 Tax=Anaeramoeba flamelloides TaxID=1746091 RepID=A0AAV7ZN56_9EUKA|nr:rho/rac/cdc gtpase-activating protein [Anaeramoeba flamelloides]